MTELNSAADRAALRDRIRRAVCEAEGFAWDSDMLEPDEYGEVADMVLAVLPPPADRAAVLLEVADRLKRKADALADGVHDLAMFVAKARLAEAEILDREAAELRRLAVEARPTTKPDETARPGCIKSGVRYHCLPDGCECMPPAAAGARQDGEA